MVASFYKHNPSIYRVLWLVPSEKDAVWLQSTFQKIDPQDCLFHLFVLLPDFKKMFWHAPIFRGQEQGKTLQKLFGIENSPMVLPGESAPLLNLRKRPYRNLIYKISQKPKNPDCVAFPATQYFPNLFIPSPNLMISTSLHQPPNLEVNQ
jgi:hypothetical protein